MTSDMEKWYSLEKPAVDPETIREGNVFAIENEEKQWCRYALRRSLSKKYFTIDYLRLKKKLII